MDVVLIAEVWEGSETLGHLVAVEGLQRRELAGEFGRRVGLPERWNVRVAARRKVEFAYTIMVDGVLRSSQDAEEANCSLRNPQGFVFIAARQPRRRMIA